MTDKEFLDSVSLAGEEWRKSEFLNNLFCVSNYGRLCSLNRDITFCNGKIAHYKPSLIKGTLYNEGYRMAKVNKNGKRIMVAFHRIVAMAFIPNPNGYGEIDHIDGNPSNNHACNLRWCDHTMNMANPITCQRRIVKTESIRALKPKKDRIPLSQMTYDYLKKRVAQIKDGRIVKIYESLTDANRDGFSISNISMCCCGKRKSHKGFNWAFV